MSTKTTCSGCDGWKDLPKLRSYNPQEQLSLSVSLLISLLHHHDPQTTSVVAHIHRTLTSPKFAHTKRKTTSMSLWVGGNHSHIHATQSLALAYNKQTNHFTALSMYPICITFLFKKRNFLSLACSCQVACFRCLVLSLCVVQIIIFCLAKKHSPYYGKIVPLVLSTMASFSSKVLSFQRLLYEPSGRISHPAYSMHEGNGRHPRDNANLQKHASSIVSNWSMTTSIYTDVFRHKLYECGISIECSSWR